MRRLALAGWLLVGGHHPDLLLARRAAEDPAACPGALRVGLGAVVGRRDLVHVVPIVAAMRMLEPCQVELRKLEHACSPPIKCVGKRKRWPRCPTSVLGRCPWPAGVVASDQV